jgi:ubiquinone/menaquinone biosynthesis C-methylase UbiE
MNPRLYDLSQVLLGARRSNRRLTAVLAALPPARRVLDVGGGTGISEPLFPASALYVCLDLAPERLRTFAQAHPRRAAVAADAARLPFATASTDLVLCRGVLHHLDERRLQALLEEVERVLHPEGTLVILEPLLSRDWLPGRILWQLDEGAYPREGEALRSALAKRFRLQTWQQYAIYHRYALATFSRAGSRTISRPR